MRPCSPRRLRRRALAAALLTLVAGCAALPDGGAATVGEQGRSAFASRGDEASPAAEQVRRPARVYLLRGLWEVFSLGLNELGAKLRARGHDAVVGSHAGWTWIADELIERRRSGHAEPIVLIGHSLGADNAIRIARRLDEAGVAVDLVITFDPVFPPEAPPNVGRLVNYFQHGNFWGKPVAAGEGFKGVLDNADLDRSRRELGASVGHMSMDKSEALHAEVIGEIARLGAPAGLRQAARDDRAGAAARPPRRH